MGFGSNEQRGIDSVRKNANEMHKVKCFRNGVNFFRDWGNLFRKAILTNSTFCIWEFFGSSLVIYTGVPRTVQAEEILIKVQKYIV